jgi:hypothetical protein
MMKPILILALASLLGACAHNPSNEVKSPSRETASVWRNRLTCDDGFRLDEDETVSYQMVIFGPALDYFLSSKVILPESLNTNREFVIKLDPENRVFVGRSPRGEFVTSTLIDRSHRDASIWWQPVGGGAPETGYKFNRCH